MGVLQGKALGKRNTKLGDKNYVACASELGLKFHEVMEMKCRKDSEKQKEKVTGSERESKEPYALALHVVNLFFLP